MVKMWRYVKNGAYTKTGVNVLNVVVKILFFYYVYGNPTEGDRMITPVLSALNMKGIARQEVLAGWMKDRLIPLSPEEIISMIDNVAKSGAYASLRKFLDVLDNCGLLPAKLPHGIFNSCYKFHNNNNKMCTVLDVYCCASTPGIMKP